MAVYSVMRRYLDQTLGRGDHPAAQLLRERTSVFESDLDDDLGDDSDE